MFSWLIKSFLMQYSFKSVSFEYAKTVTLALVFIAVGDYCSIALLLFVVTSINGINSSVYKH